MNTAEQILVIVLAAALAVFLILAIVIAVQVISLLKVLNSVALKAQELVDSAERTADLVKSAVGQLSLVRFAQNVFDMVQKYLAIGMVNLVLKYTRQETFGRKADFFPCKVKRFYADFAVAGDFPVKVFYT